MSEITVYTITDAKNIDELTSKGGGDTYNVNGGTLTIDQDSRYGQNAATNASIGVMALSATLGGTVEIDARKVRIIPYDTGTGNVPAYNTTISQGSASGKLIGVYSALNVAPTTPGSAMPASGYIKIKQWNDTAYAAGALTGIGANATAADRVGWIEVVADEALNISVNRLNLFRVRGDWFEIGTTDGNRSTTYQIPSNGANQYHPGVWVETGSGTGEYEFYACAGTLTAVSTSFATDAIRGKVCWISSAGVLRLGHDGTNSTGGYIPDSGRKIRIPNVFLTACTTAARTANSAPNATIATRPEFATTGGGALDINYASCCWYLNVNQAYSFNMTNTGAMTAVVATEIASELAWSNVGVGHDAAVAATTLTLNLNFAGGTITDCVFLRALHATSNGLCGSFTDIDGFTFDNVTIGSLVRTTQTNTNNVTATRMSNCTFTDLTLASGQAFNAVTCTNVTFTDTHYFDARTSTTVTTQPSWGIIVGTKCDQITISGFDFHGLTAVQPYNGILSITTAGCSNIKLRNIGSYASPLDLGAPRQDDVSWSRVTTTATVTKTAHGLKVNDTVYVVVSSNIAAITVAAKTVASVPTADTFTFTCLNAGATSGTLSYYQQVGAYLFQIANSAAANDVRVQRCYTVNNRAGLYTADNSSKNVLIENTFNDFVTSTALTPLNTKYKGVGANASVTAQTAVYGSHWMDWFINATTPSQTAQSWSRVTTTATVTSTDHGLRTGMFVSVTYSSSTAAIILGVKTVTVLTKDTFTFSCLNAGSTSGTLDFTPLNGRIALMMNESSENTTDQVTIDSGTPAFTAAGGLYAPTVNQQVTFTMPYFLLGHASFPISEAVMAGGGSINNFDITYALDRNDGNGFSSFKNLAYSRAGAGGSNGSTTVTMTSTTGVAVNDYVFGTNVAPHAKVVSIDSSTAITVSIANTGTVSGTLRFNQLPNESAIGADGAAMKVSLKTNSTNSTAITSLLIYTYSDDTTRAYQYVLDPVTLVVTVLDAVTSDPIEDVRVLLEAGAGGPLTEGDEVLSGVTDSNGEVRVSGFSYEGTQLVVGRARKGSSSPYYKTSPILDTVTSSGLVTTVFMIKDE